jgi:hypothetical protein
MSKTVAYKGKKWAGSVTFFDPLTILQASNYEMARENGRAFESFGKDSAVYASAIIPGVLKCVEKWNLEGIPEGITLDNIPLKPHKERAEFVEWLVTNVEELYKDTDDIPNA